MRIYNAVLDCFIVLQEKRVDIERKFLAAFRLFASVVDSPELAVERLVQRVACIVSDLAEREFFGCKSALS